MDEKIKIMGQYEKVNNISKSLEKRLLENGIPSKIIDGFTKCSQNESDVLGGEQLE